VASVRVVRDVEETDRGLQSASRLDLVVEVLNDRDVHSLGAGVDPVKAELVTMPLVNGLNGVAEVVEDTHEGLEGPSSAALRLPSLAVILKWSERDESVV
jgi:hypothetical protein